MPSHIIMLSAKLKWPRKLVAYLIPRLQPIGDQRTSLALNIQVADLFLISNAQSTITELAQRM